MTEKQLDPLSFGRDEPHHFRLVFGRGTQRAEVEDVIASLSDVGHRWVQGGTDGVALELKVRRSGRWTAVFRALSRLRQGGLTAHDFLALDTISDAGDEWLNETLTLWTRHKNGQAGRRRLESCAGDKIIERFRSWIVDKGTEAAFAMSVTAFNTPGPDTFLTLISEAHAQAARGKPGRRAADTLLGYGAVNVANLSAQLDRYGSMEFPEGPLLDLITSEWWDVQMGALRALGHAPGTLSSSAVATLCEVIEAGKGNADLATRALSKAEPTAALQPFLSEVFHNNTGDLRRQTAHTFCALWPDEGRHMWSELLTKSHIYDRSLGHSLLVHYGTASDVPAAAAELRRIIRTKRKRGTMPPFGSDLLPFLLQHRNHPDTAACLKDLRSRWESLDNDLQNWIAERYPELAGS